MTGFPGVPGDWGDEREHRRKLAEGVKRTLSGKINATVKVTLAANQATTMVSDARLSATSFIGFCPLSASAAGEVAGGNLYVSAQGRGTLTLTHANSAATDRDFRLVIIG